MKQIFALMVVSSLFLLGCTAPQSTSLTQTSNLSLSSPAFQQGGTIPAKYTCDGENINPPLEISGIPAGAETLVLIMDDADAIPVVGYVFDHWIVFNIPQMTASIGEGQEIGVAGLTSSDEKKYFGPCPPQGQRHSYSFRLYALNTTLSLPEGASKAQLENAMAGYILAQAELTGFHAR